jgi:hypothetical protein
VSTVEQVEGVRSPFGYAGRQSAFEFLTGPEGVKRRLLRLAERMAAENASVVEEVERVRIPSHPVRREIRHGVPKSSRPLGRGVIADVEMTYVPDGARIVHAVWPLANGLIGVVLCIGYDPEECTSEWLASAGAGWLPGAYEGLHQAVAAAIEGAREAR